MKPKESSDAATRKSLESKTPATLDQQREQTGLAPSANAVWTKVEDDNPKRICYVCACYAQRTDDMLNQRDAYALQFIYAIDGEPDCFDANVFVCCDCFKKL